MSIKFYANKISFGVVFLEVNTAKLFFKFIYRKHRIFAKMLLKFQKLNFISVFIQKYIYLEIKTNFELWLIKIIVF